MPCDPELFQIVLRLTGPLTTRTLENHRRFLEDMWVKSTAQGVSSEEQAAFTPDLIAKSLLAAMQDNAKTVVGWALAIQVELHHADSRFDEIQKIQGFLATEKDKLAFCERDPVGTPEVLQTIKENISELETMLRDLQQSKATISRRSSYQGPAGPMAFGHHNLDGFMSGLPPENS